MWIYYQGHLEVDQDIFHLVSCGWDFRVPVFLRRRRSGYRVSTGEYQILSG